jgi:predicted PurR-regulated permease PerM
MPSDQDQTAETRFVRKILIVGAAVAFAALVWSLREILLLVFASVLLAVILRFIAEILSARTGMTNSWSLVVGGCVVLGLIAAVITLFGTQLAGQFNVLASQLQSVERTVAGYFGVSSAKDLLSESSLGSLFVQALSWGTTAIAATAGLLLVIVGGVYMAIDPDIYRDGLIKLVPPEWQPRIRATLDDAGEALRMWVGAQLLAMVIVGVLIAIGALLIGIPSALALGLIFGLTEFVPVIGPIAGAVPIVLVAIGQSWEMALWAAGLVVLVQQLESNLIMPLVSGRAVQLPPAVGLFAVVAMGVVFGPLGLVLGYPLAVVFDVAIRRLYVRQTLGEDVEIAAETSRTNKPRDTS